VFVGAVGRSGTTLLERTLATAPNVVALGEMVHLWDRGVRDDEPCGCGARFGECPFWSAVGDQAFGGWDCVDLDTLASDRRTVDRNRYIPFLIAPRLGSRRFREAHVRLVDMLSRLYDAVQEVAAVSGPTVALIDSSKHPSYLFLLRTMPRHEVRLLHVVRDPRGVAHSWSKQVVRPESGEPMEQLGTVRACARWISHNLMFQLAGLLRVPRRRLAYEKFTHTPAEVAQCVDALLVGSSSLALAIEGAAVQLGTDHTVSGNPMRFDHGTVTIRSDDRWRDAMPLAQRLLVGFLTTPLRQVYAR
jgi:hypothetical protein